MVKLTKFSQFACGMILFQKKKYLTGTTNVYWGTCSVVLASLPLHNLKFVTHGKKDFRKKPLEH